MNWFLTLVTIGFVIWAIVNVRAQVNAPSMVCLQCHGVARAARKAVRGSFLIELVLWLCFIVPGLIYSIWRLTSARQKFCPYCGADGTMIPVNSPRGSQLTRMEPEKVA